MVIIVDGSVIEAKDEQPLNTPLPRVVMDGSITDVKDEHCMKI